MTDEFLDEDDGIAGGQLMGDKGVSEIIDFSAFDAGNPKVALNGASDISDQEGTAGFGDKKRFGFDFGALGEIFFNRLFGGFVKRDFPLRVGFIRLDDKGTVFNVA